MKKFCVPFVAIVLQLTCSGIAQEPLDTAHPNIRIEVQVVAIPQEVAIPLIPELMNASKTEPAYQQIQDMLVKGTAKLIGWPMVTTLPGQRATVEAVNELRYATEFAPGAVGVYLTSPEGKITKQPDQISGVDLQAVPQAFETRNVGVTLEVEPVLDEDQKTIHLNIVPGHVRLKAMNKVTIEREKTKEKVTVEQPEFDNMRLTTSLSIKSGERTLLGVFRPSDPPNHLELFILKAEVLKAE